MGLNRAILGMGECHPPCRAAALLAVATVTFLAAVPGLAQAPATAPANAAPKCVVAPDLARFELPLARVADRLAGGQAIKIIAVGSSSTYGFGASSPSASYPSRLKVELERHFPGHLLTVINRGVNGEEARDMLSRFETGVIAEKPHLVVWQVGTNSLLRDRPIDPRGLVLHDGLDRLKTIRADVVLMDPQYAPHVLAKPNRDAVVAQIEQIAKEERVGLLRRYAIMRRWHEGGLPFETFVTWDGLHMNDWGYACLANSLGAAIAEAATRPTAAIAVPRAPR
jgi:lysophospholipase L1-like esterase